jgi:hypothetical protein
VWTEGDFFGKELITVVNPSGPFDEFGRSILRSLAKALLPLDQWIRARKPPPAGDDYEPPNAGELPWRRDGQTLSIDRLGAIEFVEALIRESNGDALLLKRWGALQADPLKHCPIENPVEWRTARGLAAPNFGAVQSQNVLLDDRGNQIARSEFYASYLPDLAIAAAQRQPGDDAAWQTFALDLFSDSCKEWPTPARSSRFMLQFLRDLLYAILGVRNPVPEPWRSAVLTEIGELRRPGNVYYRKDVESGLDDFKKRIHVPEVPGAPVEKELFFEGRPVIAAVAPQPTEEHEIGEAVEAHYLAWESRGPLRRG